MRNRKKILISPLDWGLGHTTRCIPIIRFLVNNKHQVTIACNEVQKKILSERFPNQKYVHLEGYNITYPIGNSMIWSMAKQSSKILSKIKEENQWLNHFLEENPQDFIISDNRFGFYHPRVESIYITHQINIQGPSLFKPFLYNIHKNYIDKFHHCFIPDTINNSLAGSLSKTGISRFKHIGVLSRFNEIAVSLETPYEYLGIVSGPEPQRSVFCKLLEEEFLKTKSNCAIIGGVPLNDQSNQNSNISYFPHLNTEEFYNLVCKSKKIIARSGYSTIMDFSTLQKPIFFVPTPGQTEQEYLATFHNKNNNIGFCKQAKFRLPKDTEFGVLPKIENRNKLIETLTRLIR